MAPVSSSERSTIKFTPAKIGGSGRAETIHDWRLFSSNSRMVQGPKPIIAEAGAADTVDWSGLRSALLAQILLLQLEQKHGH